LSGNILFSKKRQRDKETNRQTDKQTNRQLHLRTKIQNNRQIDKKKNRQKDKQAKRQIETTVGLWKVTQHQTLLKATIKLNTMNAFT
jgi:hypothetical protein